MHETTVADAPLLLAVWNDPAFVHNVADRGIRTLEEAAVAIRAGAEAQFIEYGYGPYCITAKETGAQVGICGIFRRESLDVPDIGFALLPDFCRRGYAFESAQAVVQHARATLQLPALSAIVSPGNLPSRQLIEKLGLEYQTMITLPGDDTSVCYYSMSLTD